MSLPHKPLLLRVGDELCITKAEARRAMRNKGLRKPSLLAEDLAQDPRRQLLVRSRSGEWVELANELNHALGQASDHPDSALSKRLAEAFGLLFASKVGKIPDPY